MSQGSLSLGGVQSRAYFLTNPRADGPQTSWWAGPCHRIPSEAEGASGPKDSDLPGEPGALTEGALPQCLTPEARRPLGKVIHFFLSFPSAWWLFSLTHK